MTLEKKNRIIQGATAKDETAQNPLKTNEKRSVSFSACPENMKNLLEEIDLSKLVYWKLKQTLNQKTEQRKQEILQNIIEDVERPLISIVLSHTNGNQSKAAKLLGCNRNTLHRKLKDFLINPREHKKRKTKLKERSFSTLTSSSSFASASFKETTDF